MANAQQPQAPSEQPRDEDRLGSEDFIAQHQPDRVIKEIPRRQTQATRPPLEDIFQRRGPDARRIAVAYRQYGYRLHEIASYVGVHYATISRRLKQAEQVNV